MNSKFLVKRKLFKAVSTDAGDYGSLAEKAYIVVSNHWSIVVLINYSVFPTFRSS